MNPQQAANANQLMQLIGIIFLSGLGGIVIYYICYAVWIKAMAHGANGVQVWDPTGTKLERTYIVKCDNFHDVLIGKNELYHIDTSISDKEILWPSGVPWFLQEKIPVSCHLKNVMNACTYNNGRLVDYKENALRTATEARAKDNSKTREMFARISKAWLQKNKESLVIYCMFAIVIVGVIAGYNIYLSMGQDKKLNDIHNYLLPPIEQTQQAPRPPGK